MAEPQSYQLIYASQAVRPMRTADLIELLQQSREKNARLDITGLLLYRRQSFLQVLEGDQHLVATLYATIRTDDRHTSVHTLVEKFAETREFDNWSMGFVSIDDGVLGSMPRWRDSVAAGFSPRKLQAPETLAHSLLMTFREMA